MVQLDISMPKTCYECPCHDGENNSCQVTGKYYYDEILRSCPLIELPSTQQEEAIPAAWLEEQAKWFESMDNAFAKIEANNIRVMIKKWRSEKDERSD